MPHWTQLVAEKKERQLKSIPQDWIVSPLPDSTQDVTGFLKTCGLRLLGAWDMEITSTLTDVLLEQLASGAWTAVDVTASFYKGLVLRLINL